ncbi:hypothetical protein BST22_06970 [Mycolicibacterium chubuense]|uniref:DUF732 domain-containing protein n=2 Tax=Mycolicibacterium chubuense TaxID=1800 RepID=A0A0J6YYW8_MYCCU|nr:hypothetical protein MCHUDSM44219_03245 [Mycolicibacterium chubuense]ORA54348.1 hypothetical protein BST22_06970 [Mycolicibacterium chubuense]SPX96668.1 Protein of uncharacterised function (DUF732) [Mycolicibacterium chubuense]
MNRSVMTGLCGATAVAALLALAPPAGADTAAFLAGLEPVYTSLTREQLLNAGSISCAILDAGQPAPVAVETLYRQMGIALATGSDIVSAAALNLGC